MSDEAAPPASGFFTELSLAFSFLTILPVVDRRPASDETVAASFAWFPIVGFILGVALIGEDRLLAYVFPQVIRSVLIVISLTVITGAVHLDGLADTADALGAGRDRDRALDIMRDSRVGTFGASAIFFDLALKILALSTLVGHRRYAALIVAPMLARWAMLLVSRGLPYLRESGAGSTLLNSESLRLHAPAVVAVFTLVVMLMLGAWGRCAGNRGRDRNRVRDAIVLSALARRGDGRFDWRVWRAGRDSRPARNVLIATSPSTDIPRPSTAPGPPRPRFSDWSIRANRESGATRRDRSARFPNRLRRSRRYSRRARASAPTRADPPRPESGPSSPSLLSIRLETHSVRQSSTTRSALPRSFASAADDLDGLLDRLEIRRARRSMKFDSRGHFVVERLAGRDEEFALIWKRELQSLHTLAAARAAGD